MVHIYLHAGRNLLHCLPAVATVSCAYITPITEPTAAITKPYSAITFSATISLTSAETSSFTITWPTIAAPFLNTTISEPTTALVS